MAGGPIAGEEGDGNKHNERCREGDGSSVMCKKGDFFTRGRDAGRHGSLSDIARSRRPEARSEG